MSDAAASPPGAAVRPSLHANDPEESYAGVSTRRVVGPGSGGGRAVQSGRSRVVAVATVTLILVPALLARAFLIAAEGGGGDPTSARQPCCCQASAGPATSAA